MGKPKGGRKVPAAKKPPLTHFLCLPLVTSRARPQLETALGTFKEGVCQENSTGSKDAQEIRGFSTRSPKIAPKSIRPVGALHCTLGVMSLDDSKLAEAIECLQSLDIRQTMVEASGQSTTSSAADSSTTASALERPISPPTVSQDVQPLVVDLKGIVSMYAPQETSILYSAPTDRSGRLLPFCLAVQKLFKDGGFLVEDNRELKLHATVVNTIYAKGKKRPPPRGSTSSSAGTDQAGRSQGHGPNANAPLKIDATGILEKYKDFVWAEGVVLDRIAICEMGAKNISNAEGEIIDQEYTEVATLQLPT